MQGCPNAQCFGSRPTQQLCWGAALQVTAASWPIGYRRLLPSKGLLSTFARRLYCGLHAVRLRGWLRPRAAAMAAGGFRVVSAADGLRLFGSRVVP